MINEIVDIILHWLVVGFNFQLDWSRIIMNYYEYFKVEIDDVICYIISSVQPVRTKREQKRPILNLELIECRADVAHSSH